MHQLLTPVRKDAEVLDFLWNVNSCSAGRQVESWILQATEGPWRGSGAMLWKLSLSLVVTSLPLSSATTFGSSTTTLLCTSLHCLSLPYIICACCMILQHVKTAGTPRQSCCVGRLQALVANEIGWAISEAKRSGLMRVFVALVKDHSTAQGTFDSTWNHFVQ